MVLNSGAILRVHIGGAFQFQFKHRVCLFDILKKVILILKFYVLLKKLKINLFQKLLFLVSIQKLKIDFFKILIIFNNSSKYIKNNFF